MLKHIQYHKGERRHFFRKNIPLTLLKGLCVRGGWTLNRTTTCWPPTLMAITAFLSRSPGLLNREPGDPASLRHGPYSSIFSPTATVQSGTWEPPLVGGGSLYRILSPTVSNFLCTELYYCFTPTQSLPMTGQRNMQLPPSLEWHVWSSSSGNNCHAVHRSPSSGSSVCDYIVGF